MLAASAALRGLVASVTPCAEPIESPWGALQCSLDAGHGGPHVHTLPEGEPVPERLATPPLLQSLRAEWERQRRIRDTPGGVLLLDGAPEREVEIVRFEPTCSPPYDGSARRRRYWKRVTWRS